MRTGLLLAFGILALAAGFLLIPLPLRLPYALVSGVITLVVGVHLYRNPQRRTLRRSPRWRVDGIAPTSELEAGEPAATVQHEGPELETISDSGLTVTRVGFRLNWQVPLALIIRRRKNAISPDRLVRNTDIDSIDFEYELRPVMAGIDDVDQLIEIRANQRMFLRRFLRGEVFERLLGLFQSQGWYLLDLHCNGNLLNFYVQPEISELLAGTRSEMITNFERFTRDLNGAVTENLELFRPAWE